MKAPGAYVHVPFCAHRCSYCSFVAFPGLKGESDYFDVLVSEIEARRGEAAAPLDTVYFGGGTPSFVEPERLQRVLSALRDCHGLAADTEVTAEGNPDDLTDSRLDALVRLGVTRLSVGVQSLKDDELPYLERRHDASAAADALLRARTRFARLSGDLMIGIPGQTFDSLRSSLDGLLSTGVDHLSVYLLELEKAPKLVALKAEKPELFPDDDEMARRWEEVDRMSTSAGLPRYELSNWARPGCESRHNLKYWTETPTLGFGVSAHSFDGAVRRANSGAVVDYTRLVKESGRAFVTEVRLSDDELRREGVLLRLRLAEGVSLRDFESVRDGLARDERDRLGDCEAAGLLVRTEGRIALSRSGVLLSNEVFSLLV